MMEDVSDEVILKDLEKEARKIKKRIKDTTFVFFKIFYFIS
jgi:hypothetical protein